ncbi:protealysin inhibitor emfourin [Nostoc sp. PA-18-2419]|uniref:protealysin inhibitor emfourin n=1 Tax=Nostoc sp. PA-18-2419 TaxID=2575443 RepID=UPI00110860AE|nr:protealysin inhibitor emfourin [Nostoc sp. PA-18-2419]
MRISFERTGGFAGISKKTTVDTSELPANEANTLKRLVEAADFFRLPEQITSPNPQSDRFQYKLTVEDNDKHHTVIVSESVLPGTLRPLIEWLQNSAQKR